MTKIIRKPMNGSKHKKRPPELAFNGEAYACPECCSELLEPELGQAPVDSAPTVYRACAACPYFWSEAQQ